MVGSAAWAGHDWGPAATRARLAGRLPSPPATPAMASWRGWGRAVLRDGDIVFRLGDSRCLRGFFPLSLFIAEATGSPFSHTGIVAVEEGVPVVYDCASAGPRRQPFEVWMRDCVGPMGVKRLRAEHRRHIPGAIRYCREVFERQVPFDFEFHPDDAALYCLEMTEKAFRSQGLALSEPVEIGAWKHLGRYPLTAMAFVSCSRLVMERPITFERPVYVPGDDGEGLWGSRSLETVFGPEPKGDRGRALPEDRGLSLRGDVAIIAFVAGEVRRSYKDLPPAWLLVRVSRILDRCHPPSPGRPARLQLAGPGGAAIDRAAAVAPRPGR